MIKFEKSDITHFLQNLTLVDFAVSAIRETAEETKTDCILYKF